MTDLTHVDKTGRASMVDVTAKDDTARSASARGRISMWPATLRAIRENQIKKGDVLTAAKLAGIMAAKRTAELIPLCHSLPLTAVDITLVPDESLPGIRVEASATTVAKTGVEMEALTAVSVALLTIYDMVKAIDRDLSIGDIELVEKRGGRNPGSRGADGWRAD